MKSTKTYHYDSKCSFCKTPYDLLSLQNAVDNGYHECGVCEEHGVYTDPVKKDKPGKRKKIEESNKNQKSKQKESTNTSSASVSEKKSKNSATGGSNKPRKTDHRSKSKKR